MTDLESYRAHRDSWLIKTAESLAADERFVAGWLTGSLGSSEADLLSDVDLSLVVSDEYSARLCARLEQVSAQTSPERCSLFSQFGAPALIHENNNNAPEGGTFTFVLYAESALMVDWTLIPQTKAMRPFQSRLLFEKVAIPSTPVPKPEDLEESRKSVAEIWAFFWMMAAVTIKYITRGDGVFATEWIEKLHGLVHEIERRINEDPWKYTRGSLSQIQPAQEKQIESIRRLCKKMQGLKFRVTEFTGSEPATPSAEIETLLSLANSKHSQI